MAIVQVQCSQRRKPRRRMVTIVFKNSENSRGRSRLREHLPLTGIQGIYPQAPRVRYSDDIALTESEWQMLGSSLEPVWLQNSSPVLNRFHTTAPLIRVTPQRRLRSEERVV